ncbi:MAG: hypothetical protein DIJKHBIC_02964 [Thermoanaerobaculia bacterium]|nr:hypothetical protein [Thermoanaerobaculia bacterium]
MTHVYVKRRSTMEEAEWENVGVFLSSDDRTLDMPASETDQCFSRRLRDRIEMHLSATAPRLLFDEAIDWLTPVMLYRFTTIRPDAALPGQQP